MNTRERRTLEAAHQAVRSSARAVASLADSVKAFAEALATTRQNQPDKVGFDVEVPDEDS